MIGNNGFRKSEVSIQKTDMKFHGNCKICSIPTTCVSVLSNNCSVEKMGVNIYCEIYDWNTGNIYGMLNNNALYIHILKKKSVNSYCLELKHTYSVHCSFCNYREISYFFVLNRNFWFSKRMIAAAWKIFKLKTRPPFVWRA